MERDKYDVVLYIYGSNDHNGYDKWDSYLEHFFHFLHLISEQKYYYTQLKLVGEVSAWYIKNYKFRLTRDSLQLHFLYGILCILSLVVHKLFKARQCSKLKGVDNPFASILGSSILSVKNFSTKIIVLIEESRYRYINFWKFESCYNCDRIQCRAYHISRILELAIRFSRLSHHC